MMSGSNHLPGLANGRGPDPVDVDSGQWNIAFKDNEHERDVEDGDAGDEECAGADKRQGKSRKKPQGDEDGDPGRVQLVEGQAVDEQDPESYERNPAGNRNRIHRSAV